MAAIIPRGVMLRQITTLFEAGSLAGLTDGQLLERFLASRGSSGEAAFEVLLERHGPAVLRVCRGVLGDEHDAQDAFQATFLVLARRASSVRRRESVGPWLHGVALRVARSARSAAARRRAHERRRAVPEAVPGPAVPPDDLAPVLHEELARLPEAFRSALVLCHLEGRTHEEAARRLGLPVGTARSRLARGRDRLRARLIRRGLAPSAALAAVAPAADAVPTAVPATLVRSTLRATAQVAAGVSLAATGARPGAIAAARAVGALGGYSTHKALLGALVIVAGTASTLAAVAGRFGPFGGPFPATMVSAADPDDSNQDRAPATGAAGETGVAPEGGPGGGVGEAGGRSGGAADAGAGGGAEDEAPTMDVRVAEAGTGEPIAGATVILYRDQETRWTTDDESRARIELPGDLLVNEAVFVSVWKEGFAPARISVSRSDIEADRSITRTVELEPAGVMGGVVQDEQGQPIAGAEVRVTFFVLRLVNGREGATLDRSDPIVTDDEGRWRLHMLPDNLSDDDYIKIVVAHPDYVSEHYFTDRPKPAVAALRDQTAVQVMVKGVPVAGTVVGPDGEPLGGAEVRLVWVTEEGMNRLPEWETTTTDAEGRFRFDHARPIEQAVVAIAEGLAPSWALVDPTGEGALSVKLALGSGREVRGRVVDEDGNPVAGAEVVLTDWHGQGTFQWSETTDADGRFVWEHAPADTFTLRARAPERFDDARIEVDPDQDAVTLTIKSPLRVRGTVVDARTGQPVKRFRVIPGVLDRSTTRPGADGVVPPSWKYDAVQAIEDTAGRFEGVGFDSVATSLPRLVRIEAEGYKPAVSRAYRDDEGRQVWDVALEPGPGVTGVVRDPAGQPLAGAEVFLIGPGDRFEWEGGEIARNWTRPARVETADDGSFWFAEPDGPFLLFVRSEQGVAVRESDETTARVDLTLQPWGRIEGTVRVGSEPGAGEDVLAQANRGNTGGSGPLLMLRYPATADAAGRFEIERVLPGEVTVSRVVESKWPSGSLWTHLQVIDLESGATVEVLLGGTGRPVVGHLVAPGNTVPLIDLSNAGGMLSVKQPEPYPEDFLSWATERKQAWWGEFRKTEAGRAYFRRENRYAVAVKSDGTFHIEDVPPGTYTLHVGVRQSQVGPGGVVAGTLSGTASREVVVPDLPAGQVRSDEPLDLGNVELTLTDYKRLEVGDPASDFTVKTVDGETLRLADYRGKVVLLDFRATWCGPCVEETPHLKAAYDAFGDDDRFALIGLSLDDEPEAPKRYAEAHGLAWPQVHLGGWSDSPVPADYGVQSIPQILLIGPDGMIRAKDLRGDEIRAAVAEALGRD